MYVRLFYEVILPSALPWLIIGCIARVITYWAREKRANREVVERGFRYFSIEAFIYALVIGITVSTLFIFWWLGWPKRLYNFDHYKDSVALISKLLGTLIGFSAMEIMERALSGKLSP